MNAVEIPHPDPRWANFIGGINDQGPFPMSFEVLATTAAKWELLIGDQPAEFDGPVKLLSLSRSLFAHAWFDYEYLVVACLIGFQAMEAAFRVLYPEPEGRPLLKLVKQAEQEGVLTFNIAGVARAGVELRNKFSHPLTQLTFTVGMAASMLENTHRLVALVLASVEPS